MAYFASLYFSGDALTWYLCLSPEVQGDWPKLQAALVVQWSPSGSDVHSKYVFHPCLMFSGSSLNSSLPNVPIAATAPSHNGNKSPDYFERGILKVEVAGRQEASYVGWDVGGYCAVTNDAKKALRFRFQSQSSSTLFECVVSFTPQSKAHIFL